MDGISGTCVVEGVTMKPVWLKGERVVIGGHGCVAHGVRSWRELSYTPKRGWGCQQST